ncbi:tetratricopeptide repeat protein [Basilea psittacipulmonis]|uniref:Uncharacterized protein n=1 Tax=Basilea psittacipulmonis DSM 24701 TaxID=1072685 RepID=A0A077DDZ5_9BURK|nr:tetratricopeptide repeat protein [Basilea psittacipulmonis]AIL32859.1 hypothetical protein IX83_05590 [Basilea psittacipulmonis DSM 24701]
MNIHLNRIRQTGLLCLLLCLTHAPAHAGEGWRWLNKELGKITPSVDTSIPESKTTFYKRMDSLIKSKNAKAALKELNKATSDPMIETLKARAYETLGDTATALKIYTKLSESYPELAEIWNNIGVIKAKEGNIDEAIALFKKSIVTNPDLSAPLKNLKKLQSKE